MLISFYSLLKYRHDLREPRDYSPYVEKQNYILYATSVENVKCSFKNNAGLEYILLDM